MVNSSPLRHPSSRGSKALSKCEPRQEHQRRNESSTLLSPLLRRTIKLDAGCNVHTGPALSAELSTSRCQRCFGANSRTRHNGRRTIEQTEEASDPDRCRSVSHRQVNNGAILCGANADRPEQQGSNDGVIKISDICTTVPCQRLNATLNREQIVHLA